MNRSLSLVMLTLLVAMVGGCASQPGPAKLAEEDKPYCLQETGTILPPVEGKCVNAPGRSRTRDDLERTGATSTEDALHKLEPRR